jgi:diguanylate cyclase (GGDEF)-like protein
VLFGAISAHGFVLPPGTYSFRTYGVESGLENLSTTRVTQDSRGFLWVATQDGLYRYDGNRFRRYGLNEGLPSTFVPSLRSGPNGQLWVVTGAGVARWDGERFHAVATVPRTSNALSIDATGHVWIATQEGLFAGSGDSFSRIPTWGEPATGVWCDAKTNDVWVAGTGVLARYRGGSWSRIAIEPRERIDAVVIDAQRRVWCRSGNHLWSLALDGSGLRDETAALPATSNNGYLSLDARGDLWVPTDRGLAIHDANGWRVLGPAQGLPTDWARDAFEDREGSIWIASLGVHRMLGRGELVSYKRVNGLPSEVTWCFHWDREGHLLVGTDLGLARSTPGGWSIVPGTERSQVRTLIEEENGALWVAGSPAEILRIDGRNIRRYGETEGIRGRAILSIIRDRTGAIWAATRGGGLLRKGPTDDVFVRAAIPGSVPDEEFRDVLEDRNGRIWATGDEGLACFSDGKWKRFTTRDGLAHNHVSYLSETASGDLWVPYFEPLGMARIRAEGDRIRILETRSGANGLGFNKVFFVGEDRLGRLWIGGGSGVDIATRGGVEHLSTIDGLAGDDMDARAFLADASGNVFIGTSSGFSHYVARSDPPRRTPPVVTLTSATLGESEVSGGRANQFGARWQKKDFTATFSALTYFKPDIVEYEVRLAGLDPSWQRVREPRAHWSRLPPGEYRFEARARLRPGSWSEPLAVAFAIQPAWWQTEWATAGGVALLALIVWLAYRWRVSLLRTRNLELEALVEQRTRQLADLSFTDALTGMRNRRYLQSCMREYIEGEFVCLLVDLDFFKEVNDRYGHLVGDEILVSLCSLLESLHRTTDTLIRWGGEEFLYLARGAGVEEGRMIAERIRAAVEQYEFPIEGGAPIRLTCSIGFAAYPFLRNEPGRVTWEEVVDIADICLYAAKHEGRNRWIGVVAGQSGHPGTLVERMRASLDVVVASGEVEIVKSQHVPLPVRNVTA